MSRSKNLSNKVVINGKPVYFQDNADALEARENSGGSSSGSSSGGSGLPAFYNDKWGTTFFYAALSTASSVTQGVSVAMTGSTIAIDGVAYPQLDVSGMVDADGFIFEQPVEEWLATAATGFGAISGTAATPQRVLVYYQGIVPAFVSGISDTPGTALKPYSDAFDEILVAATSSTATGANDVISGYVVRQMFNTSGGAFSSRAWIRPTLPKYK